MSDVAIIGGGIMGSAVALRLAQRGIEVTVIERGIPGAEASSAAAGILGPQMEADGPGPLLDLGLKSRALYPALAAELRDLTQVVDDLQLLVGRLVSISSAALSQAASVRPSSLSRRFA